MRVFILISLLLILAAGTGGLWFWQDMQYYMHAPLKLDSETDFIIEPGVSLKTVAVKLQNRGLLERPYYLLMAARTQGRAGQIKAGEYLIGPGTTPLQLLDQFTAGKVKQHAITLIEGWTYAQILDTLINNPVLTQTMDLTDGAKVVQTFQSTALSPEGQLFPDTYHFPRGTTGLQFMQRAYEKMQDVLAEEWQDRADGLPYRTPYEALIMASIIEKETGLNEERAGIAGVFVRRLQRNMKLQSDPTVIYAMGPEYDGNLRSGDLQIDSPYNTYRHAGLPPSPIALPGRASLHAALHPGQGNALYFVAKNDGSHHFSDTLAEHNKAVARYQVNNQENEK